MKSKTIAILTLLAWAGGLNLAAAQNAEPIEPEWSGPEIVVTASSPPLWKLRKAGSTVWVLGVIEPLPAGMSWNTAPVVRVLQDAKTVVLPPTTSVGLFQAIGAVRKSHLPPGVTLDQILGPQTSADYRSAVQRLGKDPAKYQAEKPAWAALMFEVDLPHAPGFSAEEPVATLRRLAQARHIPVVEAKYGGGAMLDQLVALPDDQGKAALQEAIAGVDFALAHQRTAAQAWATGRLQVLRSNLSPAATASGLLLRTPTYQANAAKSVDDTVAVIDQALATRAPTLVVLTLTSLVRQGGALDRLRAEGVEITAPRDSSPLRR